MKHNAIFTIFKKELARFFKDRRTLIALLMPGFLIYIMYSLMGGSLSDKFAPDANYKPIIYCKGEMPDELQTYFDAAGYELKPSSNVENEKELIQNNEADLLIILPENFAEYMEYVQSNDIHGENTNTKPNIEIYYNSSDTNSSMTYQTVTALISEYETSKTNMFDINNTQTPEQFDLATEEDLVAMVFSTMMPMLLIMLLFSGCMAVAPESLAGEKERGTIATLLITPTKRSHIAIGKILALSIMALISGASSTVGVVLSLPKLMGSEVDVSGSVYGMYDYALIALVILSTVLVLITIISIISAYAKTVKEATTYVTPIMILSMLVSLSGMMGLSATTPALYAIPIFNSVQCMIGIFSFEANMINILITIGANLAITALGIFALAKMFNSEKIMFNK